MTSTIQLKTIIPSLFIALTLLCPASPKAFGVSPPPDGGYPGGNTAEGQTALLNLTTGGFNTAVGFLSLRSNTTSQLNTGLGAGTLLANTADKNTATGAGALLSNTTGIDNTANGVFALFSNTTGGINTACGDEALFSNTTGTYNTASGADALRQNSTGTENSAFGWAALDANTIGNYNTACGGQALQSCTIGNNNTAVGTGALYGNTTGSSNTAVGVNAGSNLTTGDNDIDIGYNVQGVAGESNTIRIGDTNITTTIIRGISGQTIASGATVFVASNGQLGTMTSSKRFKQDIKPMNKASEALFSLRPVSFCYDKEIDPAATSQFGLVAEEVEKVNPDLVVRDQAGKPYTVRYDAVNAMLLNEFLKEHKAFLQEQSKVQNLEAALRAVNQRLKEQEAKIERVTAQIAVSTATRQMVSDQ
ncbi:MAG: hypothetical protein DME61_00080 [Verrucomicrobia bacterium]|nr:MAG: hypothetical protein DME61_00080 [Verrucomicrobiota bacterium]PYL69444.1 MAG: hypothetical protein DMF28_03315 [Verrucomicrobiota bacterium]